MAKPTDTSPITALLSNVSCTEFKQQIKRIKNSDRFSASDQMRSLLDLLAEYTLSPVNGPLTQAKIALGLGLRDFDLTKPTVRIAAGRLRSSLTEFYVTAGKHDTILIEFPKGKPYRLEARKKVCKPAARSDEAFQKYSEGRLLWAQRTPQTLRQAVECFEKAIVLDPGYADPHAALAECYLFMAIGGMAPRKVMPIAKRHAKAAVKINPFSAEAHSTLGGMLSGYDWNWALAWKEFDRAVELDTHCVTTLCLRAAHFLSIGNIEAAAQDGHLTLKITSSSPSPLINCHVAKVFYAANRFDEAEEILVRIREITPNFYLVHWQLGMLLASKQRWADSLKSLEYAASLAPDWPGVVAAVGWANALAGNAHAAYAIIDQLLLKRKIKYLPATDLAMIYGATGESEQASYWLNRAYNERALFLSWLSVWPPFENLRRNSISATLLSRMGLNDPNLRRY